MRALPLIFLLCTLGAQAQVDAKPIRPSTFAEVANYLEPKGDVYLYFNSDQLAERALTLADAIGDAVLLDNPRERPQLQRFLAALHQLVSETGLLQAKGLGLSSVAKGGMQSSRAVLYHGGPRPEGRLWQVLAGDPQAFIGLTMMPESTVAAATGVCRVDLLWETITALATTIGPDAEAGIRELRKTWADAGDLDATMAAFTGEFSLMLTLEEKELGLLLALGVNEAPLFEGIQNMFGAHPQLEHLEIPGATAFTIRPEHEAPWSPTVASTSKHFLVATKPELVSKALSVPVGGGLVSTAEFQQLQTGMPTEGNQLVFISRRLSDEFELENPFQMLGVTVSHSDAMVAYSKQSAGMGNSIPAPLTAIARAWSAQELARARAALVAAGRPMTMEEIVPPAPADNAAPHYQNAHAAISDELRELTSEILAGGTAENHATWAELATRESTISILREIRTGAGKPYHNELDWSQGPGILLPHLSDVRNLARVITANAIHLARGGQVEKAWEEIIVAVTFSDALAKEPILISQLVRIAMFHIAKNAAEKVARYGAPTADQAARLDDLFAVFESTKPMARSIDGERVMLGGWIYENPANRDVNALAGEALPAWFGMISLFEPVIQFDQAYYLQALGGYAANLEQPLTKIERGFEPQLPPYAILSKIVLPAMGSISGKTVETATMAQICRLSIAAMRQHADSGKYPAGLEDIASKTDKTDPFSGRPYVYERWRTGFSIGSVGKNGELKWAVETE